MTSLNEAVLGWWKELDTYTKEMESFGDSDVHEILRKLSAFSARAAYMRSVMVRSDNPKANTFRTKCIDPFLQQTEFQFKVWSRLVSVTESEWKMSQG